MSQRFTISTLMRILLLSLLAGGSSGVLATALTTGYLSQYASQLGELSVPERLSQVRPQAFPESYAQALQDAREKAQPVYAGVYLDATSREPMGAAVALTSDGWFLSVVPTGVRPREVGVGNERFAVRRMETDSATGASFIKIDGQNLSVAAYTRTGETWEAGSQVFVFPEEGAFLATSVYGHQVGDELVRSSERPSWRFLLRDRVSDTALGAPVFDLSSELIGIVSKTQGDRPAVLSIEFILPVFDVLLATGKLERGFFGANSVWLDRLPQTQAEALSPLRHGALLYGARAIVKGGAAHIAGLQQGDVIVSVDGVSIDRERGLEDALARIAVGESIAVEYVRAGERSTANVVLKSAAP